MPKYRVTGSIKDFGQFSSIPPFEFDVDDNKAAREITRRFLGSRAQRILHPKLVRIVVEEQVEEIALSE